MCLIGGSVVHVKGVIGRCGGTQIRRFRPPFWTLSTVTVNAGEWLHGRYLKHSSNKTAVFFSRITSRQPLGLKQFEKGCQRRKKELPSVYVFFVDQSYKNRTGTCTVSISPIGIGLVLVQKSAGLIF